MSNDDKLAQGCALWVAAIAAAIGIGLLFGVAFGWLAFAAAALFFFAASALS